MLDFKLFQITSKMQANIEEVWLSLPEDHPFRRQILEDLHSGYKTMERGRLYHVPREHPSVNSCSRRTKTPAYQRYVAGGGIKYRR